MKYSEARSGRTFVIRLEDGDVVHEKLEAFAKDNKIRSAVLNVVGGVDKGSRLVVGPESGRAPVIKPVVAELDEAYEATGGGTIFPDESGNPVLHMHVACGRGQQTITGCVREGVKVWHVLEVVLTELTDDASVRRTDKNTGFKLLEPCR